MPENLKTDVAIVGAGISGLATAHFLADLEPVLIERQERAGGSIRTTRTRGFLIEHGPNTILDTTPLLHRLLAELGLEERLLYADERAKKRYVVRGGVLTRCP